MTKAKIETKNDQFNLMLDEVLEREINRYARRPMLPAGKKYRRTILDKLFEQKHFNVEYFREQLILIYERKSRLPKAERDFIEYCGNQAMLKLAKKVKTDKQVEKVKSEAK